MVEGYNWRVEHEYERLAWAVSYIVAPHVKRPPTMDQLLGRERTRSKADKERDFAALWGRLHPE